jgi:RNA polymerase sigma-70 factor (ECF subfamily)
MAAVPDKDREAIDAVARQYRPAVLRYLARRGIQPADLEDVTQEVFARLTARSGFAGVERPDAYLFETAANVAIDHQRRAEVRRRKLHDAYEDGLHGLPEVSPERLHADRQELELLTVALRELPERVRHVFVLARLENLPYVQIAQQLGISVSAVEKNLVKGIAHLAMRLERRP